MTPRKFGFPLETPENGYSLGVNQPTLYWQSRRIVRVAYRLTLELVPGLRMKVVMGTSEEIGRTMRSAELARLAGVSTDALRHYERVGVLPAPQRTAGNYRVYPAIALDRVRLVRRALAFGFSLAELTSLRAQLKKVLRDWDGRLAKTSATERARLL